jgi:hypothetical protein
MTTATSTRSLNDGRDRNAADAARLFRAIAWGSTLLTAIMLATWFAFLVSQAVAGWFASE